MAMAARTSPWGRTEGNPGNKANAGCVYLVYGRGNLGATDLASVGLDNADSLEGIKIAGENADDMLGSWQASAGDFNGDGLSDWIVGVPGYSYGGKANCGLVGIVFGSRTLQGQFKVSDIGKARLPGIVFVGEAATAEADKLGAGASVAGVGDVDGDGYDDVVIVAPHMDWKFPDGTTRDNCGVAYLIYGDPTLKVDLDENTGDVIPIDLKAVGGAVPGMIYVGPQEQAADAEGLVTVAPAGDVDNDGYADFLIGNPDYNILDATNPARTLVPDVGRVYLIRGATKIVP